MRRILYHGPEKSGFSRIRAELPDHYSLELCPERSRLDTNLRQRQAEGLILPLRDPKPGDLSYLRKLVNLPPVAGVVVTSDFITVQQAVSCMRIGAYDCLSGNPDGVIMGTVLDRMFSDASTGMTPEKEPASPIIGCSKAIREMMVLIERYAGLDLPVLITGETGTGKELVARSIHNRSTRCTGPFSAVNCAVYPDELVSSELFGSASGAFTGSVNRSGLFENSRGGTVFLDEIGDLGLQGQASLLRVLEEKTLRRLGSFETIPVDVRIIAATNRPLRALIKERLFRPDLFYRLNILGLTIAPLRKRIEDIPELARHYLSTIGGLYRLDSRAVAKLVHHTWPGNVRELQSVLLKATLSARNGIIRPGDICLDQTFT